MFVRIDEPKDEAVSEPPAEETPTETDTSSESPSEPQVEEPTQTTSPDETASEPEPSAESSEEPAEAKDDYSDSTHRSQAVQAFQNYGDYICPYGIEYHWFHQNISEYEGNGVWHFKVGVTITNQFDADREAVAEGRVSFIEEEVTEFEILDDWE